MTQTPQPPRDWQKDMERVKNFEYAREFCVNLPFPPAFDYDPTEFALKYWLQEAKERGEREQCLKEAWEQLRGIVSTNATGGKSEDINDYDIMLNMMDDLLYLSSLYPNTPAPSDPNAVLEKNGIDPTGWTWHTPAPNEEGDNQ